MEEEAKNRSKSPKINIADYIRSFAGHQKKPVFTEYGSEDLEKKRQERKALLLRISAFLRGPTKEEQMAINEL
jgi:hypothetical protein